MIATLADDATSASGFRVVQRRLAALIPGHRPAGTDAAIEPLATVGEPPRLLSAPSLEGSSLRAHRIRGDAEVGFAAFLDGRQKSRVLDYIDGVAIVHGRVAAVIRERRQRRLSTWRAPLIEDAVYAPRRNVPSQYWDALGRLGIAVVDTSSPEDAGSDHPFALRDTTIHRVQKERERVERVLGERWCERADGPLFIDGSIGASERVAGSPLTIGVVKSHRTLFAEGEALRAVLALRAGERSTAFRVTSPRRLTSASWYLRLHERDGHDPLWGLVRVEIAETAADGSSVTERADRVSRWILAERRPLALPDPRWDRLVYGIWDCGEYLKGVL